MKNPFSIYDFLGYLFPGIIFVLMIIEVFYGKSIFSLDTLLDSEKVFAMPLESYFLFVIISYVMGHIVAYVSSLLVEDFSNRVFGYPSKYLLKKEDVQYSVLWKRYFGTSVCAGSSKTKFIRLWAKRILKGMIFLILLPITLSVYTIGYIFEINHYITRELDNYLINAINSKTKTLAKSLKIIEANTDFPNEADTHRFVMHYAYINVKECQPKVGNYIANHDLIVSEVSTLLDDAVAYEKMSKAVNPYGDGKACNRIVCALNGEEVDRFEVK